MKKRISHVTTQAVRPVSISAVAGFTIIELMISLVLLAVAAALSLPSYRDMIEKRQLTHGAEQIMAFVNSAQLEATRQNDFVTISWSRTADNDWCFGTNLGEDACDCRKSDPTDINYCALNEIPLDCTEALVGEIPFCDFPSVISNLNAGSRDLLKAISGDGDYTFDPVRGIFGADLTVELSSDSESYALNLVVNQAGNAVICSKDEDHKVPGYGICPEQLRTK